MSTAVPQACLMTGGDWDDKTVPKNGMEVLRFTCTMRWDSPEAKRECYGNFAHEVIDSYEWLGHILDQLKILTFDVESLSFAVEYL